MSRRSDGVQEGFREEVLNVKLAELLSRSGMLSVPESILAHEKGRRLPDITVGDYWGVRVVLEGRIEERPNVRDTLERDCIKRLEEGIAAIVIGILYPPELRNADWAALEQKLQSARLRIRVFIEAGSGDWVESNAEGLSAVLRRAYESLVREDVVNVAVEELRNGIETASQALAHFPGVAQRLRGILVLPHDRETDDVKY
jgi:hypothetical protein